MQEETIPNRERLLHKLEHIIHSDKEDIVVGGQDLVNPELKGVQHLWGFVEPGGMHIQTHRSSKMTKCNVLWGYTYNNI